MDLGSFQVIFDFGGSISSHFGSWGHFSFILGLRVTLGPLMVFGSFSIHFGSGGNFRFILRLGVALGPFLVLGSLRVHFGFESHFWPILDSEVI